MFTTEIVTSGTLKEYTSRVKNIKLKVIKKCQTQRTTTHTHDFITLHRTDSTNRTIDPSTHPTLTVLCYAGC